MRKLIKKILRESDYDDMQWIRDVKNFIPFSNAYISEELGRPLFKHQDITYNSRGVDNEVKYGVTISDEYEFRKALSDCHTFISAREMSSIAYVTVAGKEYHGYTNIYCTPDDFKNNWSTDKECLNIKFYNKNNELLLGHWFEPDNLIKLSLLPLDDSNITYKNLYGIHGEPIRDP